MVNIYYLCHQHNAVSKKVVLIEKSLIWSILTLLLLLWRVGGHGGIYGDQGTFWVHHHDGCVPAIRHQEKLICFLLYLHHKVF